MSTIKYNNQLIADITQYDNNNIIFDQSKIYNYEGQDEQLHVDVFTKNPDNTTGQLLFTVPEDITIGFKQKQKDEHSVGIRITDEIYTKLTDLLRLCKLHIDEVDPTFVHSFEKMTGCLQSWNKKILQVKCLNNKTMNLEQNGSCVPVRAKDLQYSHLESKGYLIKPVIRLKSIHRVHDTTFVKWTLYEADVKYYTSFISRQSLLHPKN